VTDVLVRSPQVRVEEDPPFDAHPADANETPERRRPLRIHAVTIVVLVISLALIITAGILTNSVHRHTEQRLLDRQALQAGATLEAATRDHQRAPGAGSRALNELRRRRVHVRDVTRGGGRRTQPLRVGEPVARG